jgi:hypothetical protein
MTAMVGTGGPSIHSPPSLAGDAVFATAKTRLLVSGTIPSGTTFSTIASGANYTHAGDATSLNTSQALFRSTYAIRIAVNGVLQDKETEILWVSATTFQLILLTVDANDIITIYN